MIKIKLIKRKNEMKSNQNEKKTNVGGDSK